MQRILFIDDDVLSLQLMSRATTILGFQSILSTSPRRGLRLAADEQPALVMVDMQMDEMDGTEFVRRMRCEPDLAKLPVILCSASSDFDIETRARSAGANGVFQKPICLDQLRQIISTYANAS